MTQFLRQKTKAVAAAANDNKSSKGDRREQPQVIINDGKDINTSVQVINLPLSQHSGQTKGETAIG